MINIRRDAALNFSKLYKSLAVLIILLIWIRIWVIRDLNSLSFTFPSSFCRILKYNPILWFFVPHLFFWLLDLIFVVAVILPNQFKFYNMLLSASRNCLWAKLMTNVCILSFDLKFKLLFNEFEDFLCIFFFWEQELRQNSTFVSITVF
jgi:hypothetical protein